MESNGVNSDHKWISEFADDIIDMVVGVEVAFSAVTTIEDKKDSQSDDQREARCKAEEETIKRMTEEQEALINENLRLKAELRKIDEKKKKIDDELAERLRQMELVRRLQGK